jgi:hypothetical protein
MGTEAAATPRVLRVCPMSTDQVVHSILVFTEALCDVEFYAYQETFAHRIVESVVSGDGGTITGLWSRQSGKTETIADVTLGMCIILPSLAEAFPDDERFIPFKDGFHAGIYAPIEWQAAISFTRMRDTISSDRGKEVMEDPEIDVQVTTNRAATFGFTNGSRVMAKSASPDTNIEGDTHHLILLEEAQKLSRHKVDKEIMPMRTATGGTVVKIGTAWHSRGGFHLSIQDNVDQYEKGGKRNHFEFDYKVVIAEKRAQYDREVREQGRGNPFHLKYELTINEEIRQNGIDSDEFQMNYGCKWKETRAIAIKPSTMIKARELKFERGKTRGGFQVAGLDIGGINDATVLTTVLVQRDKPIINRNHLPEAEEDNQIYYPKIILDWMELMGDFEGDEGQYHALVNYIAATNIQVLCVDATAVGNPVFQRIQYLLEPTVVCYPFIFSTVSKHNLYKYYLQELNSGRLTYVAGDKTREDREYRKFQKEHENLDRVMKGQYVVYEASEGEHDDYPDSAALACWAEKLADSLVMPEVVAIGPGVASQLGGGIDSGAMSSNPWRGRGRTGRRR